jgi:hypothetical protein
MATPEFITALQNTALAGYMRGETTGGEWAFPVVETLHVMALATVFGSIAMVDLRMLGISSRTVRMSKLADEVLPWTWIAFICAAITGSLMFISKGATYWNNFETRAKFLCMALAGVNMAIYHFGMHKRVNEWDTRLPPPLSVRMAGALSISLWTGVVFFGRWIGFTT